MPQEFPKMLYKGDQYNICDDADQEAKGRASGWHDFGDPPAAQPEKPAPVKTQAGGKKAAQADPPAAQPEG